MKPALALLSALIIVTQVASGQAPNTQVKVTTCKIGRVTGMESPTVSTGTSSLAFKPKQWMFVEGKVNIKAAPLPRTGYLDKLTIRFYVTAKNPEARGNVLMSKEIEYVNFPVDTDTHVCVFMSPSSVKRLTGSETIGSGTFDLCGMEVVYKDNVVGEDSNKRRPGWWRIASPNLVSTESYPLLNKNETPFAMFWYDRYPEIAPVREGASRSSTPAPAAVPAPAEQPAPTEQPAALPPTQAPQPNPQN